MTATIRQAPGWWPSLVQVRCDDCGFTGRVRDLNANTYMSDIRVRLERDQHRCHEDEGGES